MANNYLLTLEQRRCTRKHNCKANLLYHKEQSPLEPIIIVSIILVLQRSRLRFVVISWTSSLRPPLPSFLGNKTRILIPIPNSDLLPDVYSEETGTAHGKEKAILGLYFMRFDVRGCHR
ncbi:hypothetical protein CDAR_187971 [Caerostris darwini]|uniref:Uncharacterized protein n=1 Tax=Caerostris darwini TaxID=1538125 RepID=A0AAV4SQT1_9ARAC|nr:hypothetical protein CDAR_187971 [Caerostris darwini]